LNHNLLVSPKEKKSGQQGHDYKGSLAYLALKQPCLTSYKVVSRLGI
jgi:hypothetical protein